MKKLLLISLVICAFSWHAYSQERTFYHYGKSEGLSQESVQSMIKDKEGFIWIGTQEGLNRFDGSDFKIYKNDFDNPNSVCGNDIEKLIEFKDYIFIGSKNNGICYYNKNTNSFYRTTIDTGTCTAFTKNTNSIYAAILNQGVFKIDFINKAFIFTKIKTNFIGNVISLYAQDDAIYMGTDAASIHKYDLITNSISKVTSIPQAKNIKSLLLDHNQLWIGTDIGLFLLNTNTEKPNFIHLKNVKLEANKLRINKIFRKNNTYYVATDNGMYLLNNLDNKTHLFKKETILIGDKNNSNSITSNRVYDFLLDKDNLWIGTNKLDVFLLKKSVFTKINTKTKPSINNNHIYAIYKTKDYLFVGTRNGLNCIDNQNKTTVITKENTNNKLAFNVIRDLNIDKNNQLWLATTKGVSVIDLNDFDPKKPKIKSFSNDPNNPKSLSCNNTRNIFIDTKNNIWISTYGGGIDLFTGSINNNDFSFKIFDKATTNNTLSSNFIFSINQSNDNTYWINTENGLNKIHFTATDYKNYEISVYNKNLKKPLSLRSNSILTTHIDNEDHNILWVGTENGLHKFNIQTEKFRYFGEKNGLTNTVVYTILEDENHFLWLTSNEGIFKFNKATKRFIHYNKKDGLINSEYNLGGDFYNANNQTIYIGGTIGIEYFNPTNLNSLNKEGKLVLTDLSIKNKEITPFNQHQILKQSIQKTQQIRLNYNDFPTKIKFANIDYTYPQSTEFVYKLLPEDLTWNSLKTQNEIQFLNLKPGDYTLILQGKGKEALWHNKPLKLQISVSPPWYKSILAYIMYLLLFTSLLLFISRNIYLQKLEHQEVLRLKEVNDLKTKLYDNITHEFRTPITVILGMLQSIKEKVNPEKNNITQPVELIERNSENLLNLVNQILDLSKLEKGKLQLQLEQGNIITHLKYLTESFHSFAEEKDVNLVFYNEVDKIMMDYDADKITQILSNLISNAVKFCKENDKIVVHIKEKTEATNSSLIIKVKDTGIGISQENLPFIFDRFYQAENNANNQYDGTGIGLALTKELVNLMQGKISVESTLNKGTCFTIMLPIQNKATINSKKNNFSKTSKQAAKKAPYAVATTLQTDQPICLIVEDNKDVATYIKMCIEDKYQVLHANNGKKGIEMALEYIPDIIISDIMMPLKNGFELCQTIKEDIKTNHIPIVLLTAKTSQDDKISGLKLGADAYLTKPFNKEELLIRLEKLITVRQTIQNKYKDAHNWINTNKTKTNTVNKNDEFINKVIHLINEHIEENDFNAKRLSELICISESQLYRKLKALTNTSSAIFIRKVKLQKAKQLLSENNMNVSEICYAIGFNNPSWFSKIFKDEFGYSPSNKV